MGTEARGLSTGIASSRRGQDAGTGSDGHFPLLAV